MSEAKSSIRLLYLAASIEVPGFNGGSTHVYEMARHMNKVGCKVVVIARRSLGQRGNDILEGVSIHRLNRGIVIPIEEGSRWAFASSSALGLSQILRGVAEQFYFRTVYTLYVALSALSLVKVNRVHLILERGDSYGVGALVSRLTGRPLFTEARRDRYQSTRSLREAKAILVYDNQVIRDTRLRQKAVRMHGGVDPELFRPLNKDRCKEGLNLGGRLVVGYAGSFSQSHELVGFVNAVRQLTDEFREIRFLMVGPFTEQVAKLTESMRDYFVFTGSVEHQNLPSYLSAMDIAVALYTPSSMGGPPYKVREYMACGLPVIVTDAKYSRLVVRDGADGLLVRPGDAEDLRRKLRSLLESKDLRVRLGDSARQTALEHSWNKEAANLIALINGGVIRTKEPRRASI